MPFLLAEILNFQGSTHRIGVGSFSILFTIIKALKNAQFINTLKRTVENLGCFKQTRNIFIPKT